MTIQEAINSMPKHKTRMDFLNFFEQFSDFPGYEHAFNLDLSELHAMYIGFMVGVIAKNTEILGDVTQQE